MVDVSSLTIAKETPNNRLAAGCALVRDVLGGRASQFVSVLSNLALIVSNEGFEQGGDLLLLAAWQLRGGFE